MRAFLKPALAAVVAGSAVLPVAAEVRMDTGPILPAIELPDVSDAVREAERARILEAEARETCAEASNGLSGHTRTRVFEACMRALDGRANVRTRGGDNRSTVYAAPGAYACSVVGEKGRSC